MTLNSQDRCREADAVNVMMQICTVMSVQAFCLLVCMCSYQYYYCLQHFVVLKI